MSHTKKESDSSEKWYVKASGGKAGKPKKESSEKKEKKSLSKKINDGENNKPGDDRSRQLTKKFNSKDSRQNYSHEQYNKINNQVLRDNYQRKEYQHKEHSHHASRLIFSQAPLFSTDKIPSESINIINHFNEVISSVRPLSSKQMAQLPDTIRDLSHELTDERGTRRVGYMNEVASLSAYINYFMWWNIVRLVRLFSNLPKDAFQLEDGDYALDAGSGPLTVPIALWLARPELRSKKIIWYCLDLSQNALADGEELYLSIAARTIASQTDNNQKDNKEIEPWKIIRIKGALRGDSHKSEGAEIRQKVALVTCANVFNELVQTSEMPPDYLAKKYCENILSYLRTDKKQTVLIVEPGVPKAARFVSLMRDALIRRNFMHLSPCPHCAECPMDGKRGGKWCNFAFNTEDAPQTLQKLSAKAGLPKERAVLSYILSQRDNSLSNSNEDILPKNNDTNSNMNIDAKHGANGSTFFQNHILLRITSDVIHLPEQHRIGFYACSEKGLMLAIDTTHTEIANGDLLSVKQINNGETPEKDKKSGATIIEI